MNGTYCGKDCGACGDRERMNCGGCESLRQECLIAECCTGKGHENCGTCGFRENCRTLQDREKIPAHILRQRELQEKRLAEAAAREERAARRAPLMVKWLKWIFWLLIASNVISLVGEIPSLALICEIATTVCGLGIAWGLLQLQGEDGRYRTAAICTVIPLLLTLAVHLISGRGEVPNWTVVLSLPAAIISLVGEYHKCMAHSSIVGGVDSALGEKWEKIWNWQKLALGSLVGSIVLVLVAPVLGALVAMAAATALVVVSVMELIALYQSAEAFQKKIS